MLSMHSKKYISVFVLRIIPHRSFRVVVNCARELLDHLFDNCVILVYPELSVLFCFVVGMMGGTIY